MNSGFVSKEKWQVRLLLQFIGACMIISGIFDVYRYFEYGTIRTHARTTVGKMFSLILSALNISQVAWVFFWLIVGIVFVIWSFKFPKA